MELGGALLTGVAMFAMASTGVGFAAMPFLAHMMETLALAGISSEMAAIADALTANRGQNITTRQAAGFRQIIYGTQRVGGVEIYRSTTGSSHDQFNYIIVIANHECWALENLYLDGRQVYWLGSGAGYTVRNGYGFGGVADNNNHVGPNGQRYNFGGTGHSGIYCEARYGTQLPGDVIGGMTANDPTWAADGKGNSPYVGGCTYVYLKIEYNQSLFPGEPEIRFTVHGKPVLDPRTNTTAYSSNPALIINDLINDPINGLGDSTVNQAQLIAAANICDEQVQTAKQGYESRYACHWHFETNTSVGDAINTMLGSMGGRISRVGGEWHIFPAAYYGPTTSFGPDHLLGPVNWNEKRSMRDLFNRVQGTYIAPNYPYNVAGNYYDRNGWANGQIQNNWNFAFQPTNYPQYACDSLHGYASDQYLNEDGGRLLPRELGFPTVLSVSQAQRLAKIALMRNRQQGSGTLQMSLAAYQLQPCDTFLMTFEKQGWTDKLLEVNSMQFKLEHGSDGAPYIALVLGVNETDASVYEWSVAEELTVYDVPAAPYAQAPYTVAPPTNVQLQSGPGTALVAADGTVTPRIEVTWDTPLDARVAHIQLQYRISGSSNWIDGGTVSVDSNTAYIAPVIAGQSYDVQVRSVRGSGATSVWVQADAFATTVVISVSTQDAIGPGTLIGEGYTDGTAGIECNPFIAQLGGKSVTYFPSAALITGLAQQRLYYVYVVDPNLTGGNLTPVATQNKADYLGKLGYFLVDSVVTPYASASTGGTGTGSPTRYAPTSFSDTGSRTTRNPLAAFDGNLSTAATVSGTAVFTTTPPTRKVTTYGDCTWAGFPAVLAPGGGVTLSVLASTTVPSSGQAQLLVTVAGAQTLLLSASASTTQSTYTLSIPSGTDLSSVSVEASAVADTQDPTGDTQICSVNVVEIVIQ